MTQILQSVLNFVIYLYFVWQPDVRTTSARSMVPEIPHKKGNHGGFTKLSWRIAHISIIVYQGLLIMLSRQINYALLPHYSWFRRSCVCHCHLHDLLQSSHTISGTKNSIKLFAMWWHFLFVVTRLIPSATTEILSKVLESYWL